MPFPFLFLALSLLSGILLASLIYFSLLSLVLALLISISFAWLLFLFRKEKFAFFFALLGTVLLGAGLYSLSDKDFEQNSLHRLKPQGYADFTGRLYKSPSRGEDRDILFLKVEKVCYQNKEEKRTGRLRVSVLRSAELSSPLILYAQDKVKVSAQLLSPKGFQNFKSFSLSRYLKTKNIHNRAFSKSALLVEKLESGKKFSPLHLISIIRDSLQKKIEEHFPSSLSSISAKGAVLEALLLGERERMDVAVTQSLQKSGLYHLIAISGAHIAIISFLIFSLLKLMRIPTRISYLLMIVFLLFYSLLVEGSPSVMRATVMALAFLFGKLIWKKVNLINTLSIAAFFLLVLNPFSLFDLGFQLTFAATLSIILFYSRIIKYLPRLPLKISEILAMSLAAQLGVFPLLATAFNRVSFSPLILNLAAIPLAGLIMAFGYVFLPLAFVSPFLARLLVPCLEFSIDLLIKTSHLFDGIHFASYRIPSPYLWTIIGYSLFLCLLLLPPKIKRQRLIFFVFFLAFFSILVSYPFRSSSKNLKLTFIDVGQGDSILVEFPGKKKMLVDGGGLPEESFDIGERVVSPFLWRKGIRKVDYLVLTHAHPDHLNGLVAVARNFKIGEFWEAFTPVQSKAYAELKKALSPAARLRRLFRGDSLQEKKVKIEVLHPERGEPYVQSVNNDQSLVLRLTYGQTSFLLTGDIEKDAESQILDSFRDVKSQVLKSPHHGSMSSSSKAFLDRVSPRIIAISVGEGNSYGFPDWQVLDSYHQMKADIYRTDIHGAVEVSSDGRRIFVRTASGCASSY